MKTTTKPTAKAAPITQDAIAAQTHQKHRLIYPASHIQLEYQMYQNLS